MLFKRNFLIFSGLLLISSIAGAGDSASFVDLGFSPDGRVYAFAQYGVKSGALRPWADLFIVDVEHNNFVPNGRISYTHDKPIEAGQDGSGALYSVIAHNTELVDSNRVAYPNQGQPLYIAVSDDPTLDNKVIVFRDFVSDISYRASLFETIKGGGEAARSSFYINLESIDSDGEVKNYTIGDPYLDRTAVLSYRIRKVLVSSSGNSLVFVIEMKCHAEGGPDIRYMVEALRFG